MRYIPLPEMPTIKSYETKFAKSFIRISDLINTKFRHISEMESVIRVLTIVLPAIEELDVEIELQPLYPNYTDVLFILKSTDACYSFIEVRKIRNKL